jgi:iron complex outermembrane receptor protein
LIVASLVGAPALAQIEEIIVTAQKRTESVQDVPISITAFSGDDLEARGLHDVQGLAKFVPNFDMPSSNNMRNVSLRIRGIGSRGTNAGIESSVGAFLDGVYMPTGAMAFGELLDIQSFEILRGPQGTLYGRNTPVGALNVTTRKPSEEFESTIRVGGGDYDHYWVNGFVGGGLTDTTAGRLSFWYRDREGFEDNQFTGDDVNDSNVWGLRGKLLFAPADTLEINVTGYYSEQEQRCCMAEQIDALGTFGIATEGFLAQSEADGYPFINFDDSDHKVDGDDEGDDNIDSWGLSMQIDYDLPNGMLFTSITAYQDWENDVLISADALKHPVLDSYQNQHNKIASQEFRITSPGGETIDYLVGLFLYSQDTTLTLDTTFQEGATRVFGPAGTLLPGDRGFTGFDQDTSSVAVYGNTTWHINEQWSVTGGLRWGHEEKDVFIAHLNQEGNSFAFDNLVFPDTVPGDLTQSDDSVTGSANVRYHMNDDVMFFASVATGYKSGGFNSRRLPPGSNVQFDNEDSITYEVGTKATWLDGVLLTNATIYFTTLEDFQESSLAPTGTGFIVGNAGEQEVSGIEADVIFVPMESLTLSASLAYLDSEYTDFPEAQCGLGEAPDPPGGTTCDREGDTPAFAPEWQYTLGAEWAQALGNTNLEYRLRADYAWVDEQNLIRVSQDSPADQDSYGLLNLRAVLGSATGSWEAEVFVNNATDEEYFIQAARQPVGATISGGGFAGAGGVVGWYGPPQLWGLQLTFRPGL